MKRNPKLRPENDFAPGNLVFRTVDAQGRAVVLETGSVTAFIATSKALSAAAADPSLSVALAHGGNGRWPVKFDKDLLPFALLNSLFGGGATPWLIGVHSDGHRVAWQLIYDPEPEGEFS